MFWVVQGNIRNEDRHDALIQQLKLQQVEYAIVNVIPFAHELSPDINPQGNVFVSGSMTLGKIAKKKNWFPGAFDDNITYDILLDHYGDHMLNADCKIGTFDKIIPPWYEFFIRPINDDKAFSGQPILLPQFEEWRDKVVAVGSHKDSFMTLNLDDKILIAPLKEIYAEYRFFIIDQKVVTQSGYKFGRAVVSRAHVDKYIIDYAQSIADLWSPNRAYDLDIALTPNGLRVIEVNNINAAGFYHCDMGKFINAINSMKF